MPTLITKEGKRVVDSWPQRGVVTVAPEVAAFKCWREVDAAELMTDRCRGACVRIGAAKVAGGSRS